MSQPVTAAKPVALDRESRAADRADLEAGVERPHEDAALVEKDLLVEDVSIDGMCGVY